MKPFNDLNAAVVGSGFIGAVHIDSIRRLGVNIAGIVGSSADRAKSKAREFGVRHTYASYDEMLADASVDVVHITSPNDEHPFPGWESAQTNCGSGTGQTRTSSCCATRHCSRRTQQP